MLLMLVLVAAGSAPTATVATPGLSAQTANFNRDEKSSGWIDFNLLTNVSIFVPVRINGQDVAALLHRARSMIYQIHRYPAELIDLMNLADGTRILVRPVLPQDVESLHASPERAIIRIVAAIHTRGSRQARRACCRDVCR
jgi:hypothetical protein